MARILYGKPLAEALSDNIYARVLRLKTKGVNPSLAIVRVGRNSSQLAYENTALQRMAKLGIVVHFVSFESSVKESDLLAEVERINSDPNIHGCIVLLPLPGHINSRLICSHITPMKDVDGVTSDSISAVFLGESGFSPCAPGSCIALLDYYGIEIKGKRVCVIGRSLVVGRPLAMLLLSRDATVTICHSLTPDLAAECRRSDIIISAAGSPGLITAKHVRPGQTVIDVGITAGQDGLLHGDVAFDEVSSIVSDITPVPGGIGVIAGSFLARNLVTAAESLSSAD